MAVRLPCETAAWRGDEVERCRYAMADDDVAASAIRSSDRYEAGALAWLERRRAMSAGARFEADREADERACTTGNLVSPRPADLSAIDRSIVALRMQKKREARAALAAERGSRRAAWRETDDPTAGAEHRRQFEQRRAYRHLGGIARARLGRVTTSPLIHGHRRRPGVRTTGRRVGCRARARSPGRSTGDDPEPDLARSRAREGAS